MDFKSKMQSKFSDIKTQKISSLDLESPLPIPEKNISLINEVIKKKEKEVSLLQEVLQEIDRGNIDEAEDLVKKFLIKNERNFLSAKPLFYFKTMKEISDISSPMLYGRSDYFPSSLTKESNDHYIFKLPPMKSRRNYESFLFNSKHIKYTVMALISEYEKEENLHIIKNPVVVFKHYISQGNYIPDADNLDCKVAIDSLQNILIPNDDLLDIRLFTFGVLSKEEYTSLHIMSFEAFKEWIKDQ